MASGGFDWQLWAGLLLIGGAAALGGTEKGRAIVLDMTKRGKRLSTTTLDGDLKVPIDPAQLARRASAVVGREVNVNAYALARMLRSEHGSAGPEVKRLLAWVCLNDAAELGWTVIRTLTYSTVIQRVGYFGRQITRRYSTAQDPYEQDLRIAETVLDERASGSGDPTIGAVKFVDQSAFSSQAGATSYAAVAARWAKEGLQPFRIPVAGSSLMFFRRGGGVPRVA